MIKLHHETLFGEPKNLETHPGIVNEWREVKHLLKIILWLLVFIGSRQVFELVRFFSAHI